MGINAEDGKNRKWILAQLDEPTKEDSEARKAGYNTIDEIARERIKRAAAEIRKGDPLGVRVFQPALHSCGQESPHSGIDLGFRHYRIKPWDVQMIEKIEAFDPSLPQQADMFEDMASKIGVENILTTWMVADGYALTAEVRHMDIAGYTAHYLDNALLYIIAGGWGTVQTKALLNRVGERKLNLNTIIVFGYSLGLESMRELEINVKQSLNNEVQVEKRY